MSLNTGHTHATESPDASQPSQPTATGALNRRTVLGGILASLGAAALGTLGTSNNAEAKPRKKKGEEIKEPELTPEQKEVAWAQEVLNQFGLETRDQQIAFCQRWLRAQKDNAFIYLPANIGRFFKGKLLKGGEVYKGTDYWAVRRDERDSQKKDMGMEAEAYSYARIYQAPNYRNPIGHESNVEAMQIELARFFLTYKNALVEGDLSAISAKPPTIPGFYVTDKEKIPPRETLKASTEVEIFKVFGLAHPASRRVFVEALLEGLKKQQNENTTSSTTKAEGRFSNLLTATSQRCDSLGCEPLDDEVARFLVLNRDALLEEPIDLDKLRTPLL